MANAVIFMVREFVICSEFGRFRGVFHRTHGQGRRTVPGPRADQENGDDEQQSTIGGLGGRKQFEQLITGEHHDELPGRAEVQTAHH